MGRIEQAITVVERLWEIFDIESQKRKGIYEEIIEFDDDNFHKLVSDIEIYYDNFTKNHKSAGDKTTINQNKIEELLEKKNFLTEEDSLLNTL